MNNILTFLKSKKAEKFYWEAGVLAIGLLALGITDLNWELGIAVIVPLLNQITKWINITFIK